MTAQQNLGFPAVNTGDAAKHIKRLWFQKRAFEEGDALICCFEETAGLGLEGQCNVFASAPVQVHEISNRQDEIACHRRDGLARPAVRFESARNRRNTAFDSVGKDSSKDRSTVSRERNTLTVAPIGQIDVFLHPDAVKRPEGKSIDGENIGAERQQLIAERI